MKGKKQKVFLSFPTIIPSSTFSKRLLIFVLHHWSMIEMHSQAEAYTLHCTLLFLHCALFYFFIIFFTLRPLFFYTFTLFYSAPYFSLMCALLFYIFALRPTLFALPLTSCTFYHAFLCVFFLHCALYLSIVSPITGCKFFESLKNKNVDPGNVES